MPKTVFSPSIDSRPIYSELCPCPGAASIVVVDDAGADVLADLVAADERALEHAQVVVASAGVNALDRIAVLSPATLEAVPDYESASTRLAEMVSRSRMGTQLLLAGSEGFMGQMCSVALAGGMSLDEIQMEHRGSVARRIQCVHCKGITEGVTTDPFVCSYCGLTLFVRDHYSRRLGAFQGVCVDAEAPGDIPETVEICP